MKQANKNEVVSIDNKKSLFDRCRSIDVSDIVKKNYNGTAYISWADAWSRLKENFPDASYEVAYFKDGLIDVPYLKTPIGFWVGTSVTVEGTTIRQILPIMDNKFNSMTAPSSRDVNDNIQRCLVKNIAMFGLGISVYQGDDIYAEDTKPAPINKLEKCTRQQSKMIFAKTMALGWDTLDLDSYCVSRGWANTDDIPYSEINNVIREIDKIGKKKDFQPGHLDEFQKLIKAEA